ncbi:ADP-ribosylglycohydrolase family protein [Kitasatospora sp. NPDC017646]|uniref:ADP-ribosylglycohydrolase family protein n=1 Tax=Kitasatospora sp. NPDC017646 TaxID=3364024 RepID=UPI00378E7CF0
MRPAPCSGQPWATPSGPPCEFGPAGALSARFPAGNVELVAGGWELGEATDDTRTGVLVAESLIERGELDLPDIFDRFRHWAASDPKVIGIQTEEVLTSGHP